MKKDKKYMVIGAGGTGGVLGAYLTRAGRDVTLIARGRHLEAMQQNGLQVEKAWAGKDTIPVKAADMERYQDQPDVIFVCVKEYSLEDTVPFIQRVAHRDTVVIPILNLYGTGRRLQEKLPELLVTDGCIYVSSNIKAPGVIFMHGEILRVVYGLPDHTVDHLVLKQVREEMQAAGIDAVYSPQIEKDALQKFSYVSPMAACGLYYDAEAGEMQKEGPQRAFFVQLIDEIQALAQAMGIQYENRLSRINLAILDDLAPTASTSMQRDIAGGKPSEIDGLIYEVVRLGQRYQVAVPGYEKAAARFREMGL